MAENCWVAQPTPGNPFAIAQGRMVKQLADVGETAAANGLAWAYSRWVAEVAQRPLVNVHRRTLDDTWRQVIRYFGGEEAVLLISAPHDELLSTYNALGIGNAAAIPVNEGKAGDDGGKGVGDVR